MAKNNRLDRINEELKKIISKTINQELRNSNLDQLTSVTKVKITPDLRYAKVYISVLNFKNINKTLEALKNSSGFIRSKIASELNLRVTPELSFVYDDSEEQGERIDKILRELKQDKK